jgi:hypothetical protein
MWLAAGLIFGAACSSKSAFDPGGPEAGTDDEGGVTFNEAGAKDGPSNPQGCDSSCAAAGGTCVNGVCTIVDNAGGLDPTTQSVLKMGGTADATFAWLYPYDKTVFARGLLSPSLQFAGTDATNVYVHMTSATLDYEGFYKVTPGSLKLAILQKSWVAVTNAVGAKDQLKVDVTKALGISSVSGPVSESWGMAQGSLRGTIYYETYDSQIAGGLGSVGIMKIQPGSTTPVVIKSGCGNVCHTASADGSTLVASTAFPFGSASYDLKSAAAVIHAQPDNAFTYGGIYPDGSIVMSATNYRTWLNTPSRLYDTKTGTGITASGWDGVITNGGTTAFSPDGKKLAFVHEDKSAHTLGLMDFNSSTKSFSGLVDLATDNSSFVGWPAFTPDSQWVVYHGGSNAQFETDGGAKGDLFIVDVATHTAHRLDTLDGYAGGTSTYLPAMDPALNFAPTVLPEAVGGYYWVVFTSHRSYGNTLPSQDNGDEYGKLWVAAIDLKPTPGVDPSHPAFFLDGQEQKADNLRGFWVLDPCKADGQSCTSGDGCCGGYCRPSDGGVVCVPPPGGCSNEYEKCTTSSDCCNTADQCINGRCAFVPN